MVFTLHNGTRARIRPVRADDKALLAAGHAGLSPATVHARFLSAKPRLSLSELRYLTEVDGANHVALIAVDAADPRRMLGIARFIRDADDPTSAELGIVIADAHQGSGLGTQLGLELADAARRRGIARFTAVMLPENRAALALFARISDHLRSEIHAGVRELVAELPAAA